MYDVAIIGGGILGTATARELLGRFPRCRLVVLEKEPTLAAHQTGHNSGVIHSGLYYRPGSHKARLCVEGARRLVRFCQEHDLPHEMCGKVVVATDAAEVERLERLYERGTANGVQGLEVVGPERLKELEPYARGIRALHVRATGIVDFTAVVHAYAREAQEHGAEILTGARVVRVITQGDHVHLETTRGDIQARHVVNCAGLHADRVARMMGTRPPVRIVPFRGEYYTIREDRRHLVRNLIYPVPDPRFPFLGVHFTRRVSGEVEAGPNAVLALAREGYRKTSLHPRDLLETVAYPGFWRLARRYWRVGLAEFHRSLMKRVFLHDLQRLLPAIQEDDLAPGGAGVRAQALTPDGSLLDDFCIEESPNAIHVLNAPSPAATASLAIADHIVERATKVFGLLH